MSQYAKSLIKIHLPDKLLRHLIVDDRVTGEFFEVLLFYFFAYLYFFHILPPYRKG